jgi:hypothetical protein
VAGSNHGITIDHKGNVWIGGNGGGDGMVLKFTQDGKFLMMVGKKGVPIDSNSTEHFGMVAKISIDKKENEAYISDGYGNKRVVVIDADTGKFKRYWGAYGNKPDDTNLGRYNPTRRSRSSSARRCTAPRCRSIAWSTSATA